MYPHFRQSRATLVMVYLLAVVGIGGLVAIAGSARLSFASASVASPAAPLDTWSAPQDFTGGDAASDSSSAIGVAPNGSVTMAWERQVQGDRTYIFQRSNTVLNGAFGSIQQLYNAPPSEVGHNIRVAADS